MIQSPCAKRWEELTGDGAVRHCSACDTSVIDTSVVPIRVAKHLSRCLRMVALAALATPALAGGEHPEPAEREVVVVVMGGIGSVRERVSFDFGSAVVHARHLALLDETATIFRDHPEITLVEVQGHSETKEPSGLGLMRAEAVVAELVRRGVQRERVKAIDFAATRPLDESDTPEARARNRRVDFEISAHTP